MKKIIAAIDGLKYSKSSTYYSTFMAKKTGSRLVGVFLDDFTYNSYKIYDLLGNQGISVEKKEQLDKKDSEKRKKSVLDFKNACEKLNLNYSIHHDRSIAIQELLHESIYADLIVIDSRETLTNYEEKVPTDFIRDLLSDVQCPVLIVPPKYKPFEKIVVLYDGGPSSVYAVKMFSYLFSFLKELSVEVLSVKTSHQDLYLPDDEMIKEFMVHHFPNATFTVLKGYPQKTILGYIKKIKQNTLVVAGAYQRSRVSRWFKPSMADAMMLNLKVPLFIAHNK
ncbi:MAG: universal stress protein [Bacteroidia bacterium]|nr:universal stress protein [Bacteroidia bacterium]